MEANAATTAHPDIDTQQVGNYVQNLYFDMLSAVPYLTGGGDPKDALQAEREAAAAEYKRIFVDPYKLKPGFEVKERLMPTPLKSTKKDA
jgi:hypothetical protein